MKHTNSIARMMILPVLLTGLVDAADEYDAVVEGKRVFDSMGCIVCHSTQKDDPSVKAGPSLYGVFVTTPRQVMVHSEAGNKPVAADRNYFVSSVRHSWDELAVAESGPTKGNPYPAIMPSFASNVISDTDLESIWHYLRTLAEPDQAGPKSVMLKRKKEAVVNSLLEIPGEVAVVTRPRVIRAPIVGMSARSLYVGMPDGMNYGFDPRFLSVRKVWSGGFLNMKGEQSGRASDPSVLGRGAAVLFEKQALLAPLTSSGEVVDFEFKEPDVGDDTAIAKYLNEDREFLDRLAALDAEFLGHRLDLATGEPAFRFRVGKNTFSESVNLTIDGKLEISLHGKPIENQSFKLCDSGLRGIQVDDGELRDGVWTLKAAKQEMTYRLTAQFAGKGVGRLPVGGVEHWEPQSLVVAPSAPAKKPLNLSAGYSALSWQSPVDLFGRKQLFEATGIAVAKDGTIVISTRASGIWRIRSGKWSLFAEGTFESLGVCIEDDHGDQIVITQKPELTRITDTDHDGRADVFDTLCDDYGFHGNYHEYAHGPVRDKAGNYYFNLNLAHTGNAVSSWRAGGPFMGSMGGYRGWSCRVTPEGKFEPFAYGLRSPAGLAFAPDGRLWYAENQGEYVGSSKMVPLEQGKFYGHISGLVDLPGMKPNSPELDPSLWKDKLRKGAVWIPYGKLANSPGNPAWDVTGGKFGPYPGQMFIGDQTLSTVLRVVTETVNGVDQGCVMPFASGLASGVMRPCFLPDGSLLLGQTGRGWGANGGNQDALQQLVWDGKTVAADILSVGGNRDGFEIRFTRPIDEKVTADALAKLFKIKSWFYTNTPAYGSAEHDQRDDGVESVEISPNRRALTIHIANYGKTGSWLDRIFRVTLQDTTGVFGDAPVWKQLEAYFTLEVIQGAADK